MIFAFKYMYLLLGVRNLGNLFLHKLFLNERIKNPRRLPIIPNNCSYKNCPCYINILKRQVLSPKVLKQTVCVGRLWQILVPKVQI